MIALHIIEDKNGREGKGYPNPDQTFRAEFNELLFISIALKAEQNFVNSLMIRCLFAADPSENSWGMGWKTVSVRTKFSRGETQFSSRQN